MTYLKEEVQAEALVRNLPGFARFVTVAAIEVKSGAVFNDTWCRGLRAFGTPPGVVRRLVVSPDTPDLKLPDGIEVISYRRLAAILHHGNLFGGDDR